MNTPLDQTRGDLLVLAAAAIWGVAFYFQKTAMLHIGPLLFLGLRSVVAAIALLPFALREQNTSSGKLGDVTPIAMLGGVVFFIAGSIQQFGIVNATVINTGLLTALYVVATPFAFWAIKREAPSFVVWISVGLAFLGIWILSGGSLVNFTEGDVLVAVAGIIWGIYIVVVGEAGKFAQPLTFTCIQFFLVATVSLILAATVEPISIQAIFDASGSIAYVGLLSSALTFGIMAIALRHISAPRASVMLSVEVLFAASAGYILLGERLAPIGWVGAGLILAAVLVIRLRSGGHPPLP